MLAVFIYGPAASGKYTIGSKVSEALNIPLFHNHLTVDLTSCLFEFGSDGFRALRANIWRSAFRECAKQAKSFVFTFHPEATVEPSLISELTEIIEDAAGSIFFVELECSTAAILERLGMESRKQFGKLTDTDLYQTIDAEGGFEYQGIPQADIRIDTESMEPAEAARIIAAALTTKRRPHF